MATRIPTLALITVVAAISMFVPNASTAASHPLDNGKNPGILVKDTLSDIDKNWPIVQVETYEVEDPATGQVQVITTTTREAPPAYRADKAKKCTTMAPSTADMQAAAACIYSGTVSKHTQNATLVGVTANIKQFADHYCESSYCYTDYYDPYEVDYWWTRIGSNWKVESATFKWGCNGCRTCSGNNFNNVKTFGPFTPSWSTTTMSKIYILTAGNEFVAMQSLPSIGAVVNATSNSKAYQKTASGSWAYQGTIFVQNQLQ